jgi:hypothetical protein
MISILVKYPRRLCTFPFVHQLLVTQASEAHAPSLENHNLNWWLAILVDDFPSVWMCAIALAIVERFIVAGDADIRLAGYELREDLFAEGDVVSGGLAAVLDQWVVGLGFCELSLVCMGEVEVID